MFPSPNSNSFKLLNSIQHSSGYRVKRYPWQILITVDLSWLLIAPPLDSALQQQMFLGRQAMATKLEKFKNDS